MVPVILVFAIVFLLNVIPAFAPPTWMVFSFIGFQFPDHNGAELAFAGALAATLGRIMLAKLSRVVIRGRFLSEDARRNVDAIREGLQGNTRLTFGLFLVYAFSPLPSNYLFIAYGLTAMDLKLIAIPFFLGRSVSYSFWRLASVAVARKVALDADSIAPYMSGYFILSQVIFLFLLYAFTRVDWRLLFLQHKLGWTHPPLPERRDSLGSSQAHRRVHGEDQNRAA
ncbi:MAG TPA: hypothetical protein VFB23_15830 [Candidatus Acidoferrales bacterium]|nr:hypothetical protein [Candidatus Acidoferrales bacterium]